MVRVTAETNGKGVKARHNYISNHSELDVVMAYVHLEIGNLEVSIAFETDKEMIEFCEEHNFPYVDKRGVVE